MRSEAKSNGSLPTQSPSNSSKQPDPDPAVSADPKATPTATPTTGLHPPPPAVDEQGRAAATPPVPSLTVKQLQCPNERRPFVLQDEFEKLVLKQCTSSRFKRRPAR